MTLLPVAMLLGMMPAFESARADGFDANVARVNYGAGDAASPIPLGGLGTGFVELNADGTFGATATQLAEYVEKLAAIRQELRADDDARADRLIAQTEERLDGLAKTVSEALATSMEKVVASAQAAPEAAAKVIDDAAARLKAQSDADEQRDALLLDMIERFDALAKSIDARSAEHAERVVGLEAKLHETYAQTAESWTEKLSEHAERVAGLETKLQETYAQTAESWGEKLVEHQKAIEEAASQTNTFVREAAEALQRGGADLTSVSELFNTSVDRYRDASEKWLTGLSVLRAAAERAAQADAQDMLAAYLEQTREVFDSTLQFQRQLFNELRRIETREDVVSPRLLATGTEQVDAEAEE
jgi:ABC-type transporter Mla subunit MlaD